nr:MAG TPA: hypothetical protein [Caudoviricetes sp.]
MSMPKSGTKQRRWQKMRHHICILSLQRFSILAQRVVPSRRSTLQM